MSEVKTEETKKETKSNFKLVIVGLASAVVAAWNYIIVPCAATSGLVLPPMPIEQIISFLMTGGL